MKRSTSLLVTFLLALPLLAAEMTKIQVHVTNLEGRPVDRASVVVRFVEGHSKIKLGKAIIEHWETRTDQQGIAKIPSLPQGKILIQVIAKGYQTFGKNFMIEVPEKTVDVKLNPPQPQWSAHEH
jgi:hypothetical protein